jgi:hypothetical protein
MQHQFVVYGRLARQMVPFFCLVTAAALCDMRGHLPRRARPVASIVMALLLLGQAVVNFAPPLKQVFPAEFRRPQPGDPRAQAGATLLAINAKHLYPGPEPIALPDRYVLVRKAPHPLQYLPYQYEGYTPEQRKALRQADISMRLILIPAAIP